MAELTNDDVLLPGAFVDKLEPAGISDDFLIKRLKREFNAREKKTVKVKGAVNPDTLAKGYKIVAVTGLVAYDKESNQVFGDGETLLEHNPWDMKIQQGARKDVHQLRRDYPAEKLEVEGLKDLGTRLQKALERKAGNNNNHDRRTGQE
jgi:hypothetical protein